MIATGLIVTLAAWALLWAIGDATARLLFGPKYTRVATAFRLPLGVASTICLLEGAGYFLPIRVAAWLSLAPAAYGLTKMGQRLRTVPRLREPSVALTSLLAVAIGLLPVAIAGRFTAASLTNNDGTYYITVADRLIHLPWMTTYPYTQPDQCLNELVLHYWNWRTGTPNLMAAVSALSGMGSQAALAVVTALLFACVPPTAIGVARGMGLRPGTTRDLVVGLVAACSSAPAFLGYQHMTGHLAACSFFPLSAATVLGMVRGGGVRRCFHAALFLGGSVAFFADGSTVLVFVVAAAVIGGSGRLGPTIRRATACGVAAALVAPFTLARAFHAAVDTTRGLREVAAQGVERPAHLLFPQRGWLPRSPIDNLATLTGTDPWPPWPAVWPPNAETVVEWIAALSGAALFVLGIAKSWPKRVERVATIVLVALVLLSAWRLDIHYLKGKVLLTGAAFALPVCALGAVAALARPWARLLIVPYALGELFAQKQLLEPARWKVVDRPAHDALVSQLALIPPGSLIAFDGLGAPADDVLDAHRAHRAALLAHLAPIQPGLDGGFYTPRCPSAPRPDPLPRRAYALQRPSSETLTRGTGMASWDGFRLLEVDLESPDGFVAAWAPTHGWMRAEQEPGGAVFRWAEWQAKGTLQVVARARCARLGGELRVIDATASVGIKIGEDFVFTGDVGAAWSPFATRRFSTISRVPVAFHVLQTAVPAPDPAHALAVRGLFLEPTERCGAVSSGDPQGPIEFPLEFGGELEFSVELPVAAQCAKVALTVAGESGGTVRVSVDGGPPVLHYMAAPVREAIVDVSGSASPRRLRVSHSGGSSAQHWQVIDVDVLADACSR